LPEKVSALGHTDRARRLNAPGKTTAAEWSGILDHFGHRCAYCLRHEADIGAKLTKEHVEPLTRGGTNWPDNLVPACKSCNSRKNNSTLVEFAGRSRLIDRAA
jgi:5-methylcytosine-specific restriction endonuclease McrA